MTAVMVDIETLGCDAGCVILSIGACTFDPKGDGYGKVFHTQINLFDSLMNGFKIEDGTLEFWQKQNKLAQSQFIETNGVGSKEAIEKFADWFDEVKGETLWCQGLTFDVPLLNAYYKKLNSGPPWRHWAVRDTRTVYDVCGFDAKSLVRDGVYHNALDDCKYQVKCVQTALKGFNGV